MDQRLTQQRALERRVAELRDFVENAVVPLHRVAADGKILWANRAEMQLLGYAPDEYVGHHISEFHADRTVLDEILACLGRGEQLQERHARLRHKDGSLRDVIIYSNGYFEDGQFRYTRCFTIDVSQHAAAIAAGEHATRALRETEQRLRAIDEASPLMIWIAGTDRLCNYFNRAWLEFVGRSLEQELGNGWAENVHPDDFERCLRTYSTSFDARRSFQMEYRLRHHSGQYRWITDHGVPWFDPDGAFLGYVGGCLDVHEQRLAEEARYRLAAIVDSSEDAVISKDLNGVVTSWNAAAERIFGWTATDMIGRSILTVIPPELHPDEDMILGKIRRGERVEHFETERLRKDGTRINLSLTISPVKDAAGRIVGAAKIARDITDQRRREDALRRSEKMAATGQLAASIAHEINNPMQALANLLALIGYGSPADEKTLELVALAQAELNRMSHIARQMLSFYRESPAPVALKLTELMEDVFELVAMQARANHIRIVREYESKGELHGYPVELRQLFANLITNAVEAIGQNGELRIRVSRGRDWKDGRTGVRVLVCDTGHGIAEDWRRHLFAPFFTTKTAKGTGLGLWVARGVVEKHHGSIRLRTRTGGPRRGTVFSVFLPAEPAWQLLGAVAGRESAA